MKRTSGVRRCGFLARFSDGLLPAAAIFAAVGLGCAASPAGDIATALKQASFDPARCYRIRDFNFVREDIKLYLTDGYLMLSRPVGNGPIAALFSADVDQGDAEVILLPPTSGERQMLARFTGTPNLDEHFKSALFIFSDQTAKEVDEYLSERQIEPVSGMGAILAEQHDSSLRNLLTSFEARMAEDLAGGVKPGYGLFFASLAGTRLGNFDVIYDPQASDQVLAGQLQFLEQRPHYNVWTNFPARRVRRSEAAPLPSFDFRISHIAVRAAFSPDLQLTADATLKIVIPPENAVRTARNTLSFEISPRLRVREALVDGVPVQVMQRDNLRSNLLLASENEVFLLALDQPLSPGEHTVEFHEEGSIVVNAGNQVYFVGARGAWYPNHGLQFADYDLTFRYPANLTVVTTGDVIEERVDGEFKVTRRRSSVPLRIAGFNLGEYKRSTIVRNGVTVDIYANKAVEAALTPSSQTVLNPGPGLPGRPARSRAVPLILSPPAPPDPAQTIAQLAAEVAETCDFFTAAFGPPPLKALAVSPIPGAFGQGFPGLIYLSTLAYLRPQDRPQFANTAPNQLFFSDILVAHEVAHQWWGNVVSTIGNRDEWIMEALANYSALLLLEKRKGPRALNDALDQYRANLLEKNENGATMDSSGPIQLGSRLATSDMPRAHRVVIYGKGTWIMHMLRNQMGDANFLAMLRDIAKRYAGQRFTTASLRETIARHEPKNLPKGAIDNLFAGYVEGTGIPVLKLVSSSRRTAKGITVEGHVEQSGVSELFSVDVPVEIDLGRGRTETRWVRTDGNRTPFEWTLSGAPAGPVAVPVAAKVTLDPAGSVLAVKSR